MGKKSKQNTYAEKMSNQEKNRFFPISPLVLQTDTSSDFQIYLYHNYRYVLYTNKRENFTKELKEKLYDNGIDCIYVPHDQKKEYDKYVNENLKTILNNSEIPIKERSKIFLKTSNNLIQEIFEKKLPSGVTQEYLEDIKEVVYDTIEFLDQEEAIKNIGKLISHDYKTYSHCVHVFTYTMALLNKHEFSQKEKVDVGMGALLHDVGKRKIPKRILNKPGKLEPDEWNLVKQHPVLGMNLCSNLPLAHMTIKCIMFHHEKYDGSGYPSGLQERNIPLPIRYLTCCDVYDAITSERPYAPAETSFNALKIMRNHMQGAFDTHVYKELVMLLSDSEIT